MNRKQITITDYVVDSGYNRVNASYDSGKPYEDIKIKSFDTVAAALAWVAEVVKDAAFLSDARKKDNCVNCINMRPCTLLHNDDRISCKYAEGWPHWSTKCNKWEKKEESQEEPQVEIDDNEPCARGAEPARDDYDDYFDLASRLIRARVEE